MQRQQVHAFTAARTHRQSLKVIVKMGLLPLQNRTSSSGSFYMIMEQREETGAMRTTISKLLLALAFSSNTNHLNVTVG